MVAWWLTVRRSPKTAFGSSSLGQVWKARNISGMGGGGNAWGAFALGSLQGSSCLPSPLRDPCVGQRGCQGVCANCPSLFPGLIWKTCPAEQAEWLSVWTRSLGLSAITRPGALLEAPRRLRRGLLLSP